MSNIQDDIVGRFDSYTKSSLRNCLLDIRRVRDKLANNEKPFTFEDIFEFTMDAYDKRRNNNNFKRAGVCKKGSKK